MLAKASSNLLGQTSQAGIYIDDELSFITWALLMQKEISETLGFNSTPAQLIAREGFNMSALKALELTCIIFRAVFYDCETLLLRLMERHRLILVLRRILCM
jgi:hypothetical protein